MRKTDVRDTNKARTRRRERRDTTSRRTDAVRLSWRPIIERAAEIAGERTMTLRQCFYILVSESVIPNAETTYKSLSRLTAEARRDGWFPSFIDGTRGIFQHRTWDGPEDAISDTARRYRRDRTAGQERQVRIAGEKRTLARQLEEWFGDLGCPLVVCAGYSSQTLCDDVRDELRDDGRPSLLIYAGDFDPSGQDIARDFVKRVDAFDDVVGVAVSAEQVETFRLPPMPGKPTDARAAGFVARHGWLIQVEVEAVPPDVLYRLYRDAIDAVWDTSAYEDVLAREAHERQELLDLCDGFGNR